MLSGIYQIKNTLNGKCYIGSAVNLKKRWQKHLATLRRGKHCNRHLQGAFDKYGEDTFMFEILKETELENLIKHEQHYLDTWNPEYNISPTAGSCLGVRRTDEARARRSIAMTGERNPFYGKHHSAETKQKNRESQTGKHHTEETKQKNRRAQTGKRHSVETCAKISMAMTGERNPNYGRHPSEETRRKHSETISGTQHPFYGKHHTKDAKQRISMGLKAYWRRVREAKNR